MKTKQAVLTSLIFFIAIIPIAFLIDWWNPPMYVVIIILMLLLFIFGIIFITVTDFE